MRICFILLLVASLALPGCNRTRTTLGGKSPADWAEQLKSSNAEERTNAMVSLARIAEEDPAAVPYLAEGLKDPAHENRMTALMLIQRLGPRGKDAVPALREAEKTGDARFKEQVAQTIRKVEGS